MAFGVVLALMEPAKMFMLAVVLAAFGLGVFALLVLVLDLLGTGLTVLLCSPIVIARALLRGSRYCEQRSGN